MDIKDFNKDTLVIGSKKFSKNSCCIVAEVAQAHDGSIDLAHYFIDAVANAGADAIKFQTHIADAEGTAEEPWRVKFTTQDKTRHDYWKRMEFSEEEWLKLKEHAENKGLVFLSSPFSLEAVEMLIRIGTKAWKIASGEVGDIPVLERIIATGLPIILSTGMSSLDEIDKAAYRIISKKIPLVILQATSAYPTPPEKVGINMLSFLRARYGCPVGISDHSGTIYPALSAAALGARVTEVHISLDRQSALPDVTSSVTISELKQLTDGIRFIEKMLSCPIDKDYIAEEMKPMRRLFTKSVVAKMDLEAGTVLEAGHLITKKPGSGIPAENLSKLIGKRLKRPVDKDELLKEGDFE